MNGPDFTTALRTLGLDNQTAADWLGVSLRAVQRYRKNGVVGPVERAVRERLDHKKTMQALVMLVDATHAVNATSIALINARTILATTGLALDWRE